MRRARQGYAFSIGAIAFGESSLVVRAGVDGLWRRANRVIRRDCVGSGGTIACSGWHDFARGDTPGGHLWGHAEVAGDVYKLRGVGKGFLPGRLPKQILGCESLDDRHGAATQGAQPR